MSRIVQVVLILILVFITVYAGLAVFYPGPQSTDLVPKMEELSEKKNIQYPNDTQAQLLGSASSTVMGFFKLENGDKTVKFANRYTPLLYVDNNWYLELAPAPVGKNDTSARLRVQTNHAGTFQEEMIELPNIPKQKWICISILREGRRFDIMYDNQLVASQRLENYPVVISGSLSIGNKGLSGKAIHVIVTGTRLTPEEVERNRLMYVDTNNTVIESNTLDISLPAFSLFARCPSGLPCDPITKPPSNHLLQWNTPYA